MKKLETELTFRKYATLVNDEIKSIAKWLLEMVRKYDDGDYDGSYLLTMMNYIERIEVVAGERKEFETDNISPYLRYRLTKKQLNDIHFSMNIGEGANWYQNARVMLLAPLANGNIDKNLFNENERKVHDFDMRMLHDFYESRNEISFRFEHEDIVITDPCYLFEECKYSSNKNKGIYSRTLYGDWSCEAIDDKNNRIGTFCADAGLVCVCAVNDNIKDELAKLSSDCYTLIRNFTGTAKIVSQNQECHIEGAGTVNFNTRQIGC